MLKQLKITTLALSLCLSGLAQADSILVFEKTAADGSKEQHTVSITGRWLRIDSDVKDKAGLHVDGYRALDSVRGG